MGKLNKKSEALSRNNPKLTIPTLEIIIPIKWNDKIFDRRDFKKGYGDYLKQLVDTATFCGTKVRCKRLLRASKEYASIDMFCTRFGCNRKYKIIVPRKRKNDEPTKCVVMVTGEINHSHLILPKQRIPPELIPANNTKKSTNNIKLKPSNTIKLKPANSNELTLANSIKLKPVKTSELKIMKSSKWKLSSNSKFIKPTKKYSFKCPKKEELAAQVALETRSVSVIVAHLDTRKLNYKSEMIYNYTLAIKFQQTQIFLLAERMSSYHDEESIYNWLNKFREMCEVKNSWPPFNVIIADFDAIVMSAIMRAFNSCTLTEYVNLMHACVTPNAGDGGGGGGGGDGRGMHQTFEKTIILKCGKINFQRNIEESIAKNVQSVHAEQCIRKMVSCLYEESNYLKIKEWFRDFSMLLLSKADDDQTLKIKQRICAAILGKESSQDLQDLEHNVAPLQVSEEPNECNLLCEGNRFLNDFNLIYTKALKTLTINSNPEAVENVFHCEEFLKIFQKSFALYVPLWTALIFNERQNNSDIENMLFVDALLQGKGKVRIGRALRMLKNKATWLYDNGGHISVTKRKPYSKAAADMKNVSLQTSLNTLECIAHTMANGIVKASLTNANLASLTASRIPTANAISTRLPNPNSASLSLSSTCLEISNTFLSIPSSTNTSFANLSSASTSSSKPSSGNTSSAYLSSASPCFAIPSSANTSLENQTSLASTNLANKSSTNLSLCLLSETPKTSPKHSSCVTLCHNTNANANANISAKSSIITLNKKKSTFILCRKLSCNPTKSNLLLVPVEDERKNASSSFPRLKELISPALNKPINYYVIRAEETILKYFDFDSLLCTPQKACKNKKLYLHDVHIDFFTTIFARSAKINGFQIFESYIGERYIWSQLQNRDEKSQVALMKDYPFYNYIKESVVFIPICHKSHWCLAIADFNTLQIAFYDPMIKVTARNLRVANEFRRAFTKFLQLYNRIVMRNLFPARTGIWRVIPIVYPQFQQDNYNCGCFILNCIEERLSLRPPNFGFNPSQYRKYLAITALEFGDPYDTTMNPNMDHYCLYCSNEIHINCVDASDRTDAGAAGDGSSCGDLTKSDIVWLSCNYCNYLVHVECVLKHHNVNPEYRWRNDFVCLLCER